MSPCKMINLFRDVVINVFPKKHDLWVEMPTYPPPPILRIPPPLCLPPSSPVPFQRISAAYQSKLCLQK